MPGVVPGRGLEPLFAAPKTAVLPIGRSRIAGAHGSRIFRFARRPDRFITLMGSLIKKRRKRMRKKKHKKMLRRTRHQRRK